jgi:hypothetical protein
MMLIWLRLECVVSSAGGLIRALNLSSLNLKPDMRKKNPVIIIFTLTAIIQWHMDVPAQQPQSKCSQINYSTPPVNLKSYRLNRIAGQAVYASPSQKWELGSGNGLCVALFNRKNGERIATVTTDGKGQFEFVNIASGEYVLIAVAGDLQKIIIQIQLIPTGTTNRPRRLLLHLREKEDKRKSYATPVTNLALRRELLAMVEQDQNIRNEMIKSGVDHPGKAILARLSAIDLRNTARMKSIIRRYGWPDAELVGWDGTEAAFILVQHAEHSFQKELLPLMQKEYRAGVLSGPNYALFTDRVLVDDGRPQVYGSRAMPFAQWQGGEPVLYPIVDEANVDKRRAEVGLSPLAEYREMLKQKYYPQNK